MARQFVQSKKLLVFTILVLSLVMILFPWACSDRTPTSLATDSLEINGDLIAYDVRPGRGPSVVLLHGFGMSSKSWGTVVNQLTNRDIGVITIDLLDHGSSIGGASTISIERQADAVISVLNQLQEQKYVVIGHSYGGRVAFQVEAQSNHDQIKALGLVSSWRGPIPNEIKSKLLWRLKAGRKLSPIIRKLPMESPQWLIEPARSPALWNDELIDGFIEEQPIEAHSIKAPVFALHSSKDYTIPYDLLLSSTRDLVPDVELTRIESISHQLPLTHPDEVAKWIYEIWRGLL